MKLLKTLVVISMATPAAMAFANDANTGYTGAEKTSNTRQKAGNWSSQQIMDAQRALDNQGYSVKADGVMGSETRQAIRDFQQDKGITQTGLLDSATMAALNINSNMDEGRAPASVPGRTMDDTIDTTTPDVTPDIAPDVNDTAP